MAIATLQAILQKIRRLTGANNTLQMSDNDLIDYVNSFYDYDFPAQFRSLKLKDIYTFNTMAGIDVYPFPSEQYSTVSEPCYIAKKETKLFNSPANFYASYFNWQYFTNFATGNGTTGPYSGFAGNQPIIRSVNTDAYLLSNPNYPASQVQNILITAPTGLPNIPTQNLTDDGEGNLIVPGANAALNYGVINYQTGQINIVSFPYAVPSGGTIQIQYNPSSPNMPLAILFFQNQITLRPVPDQGYTVEVTAYRLPSQALNVVPNQQGTPELNEWWECIAVGAAKKFFEDSMDMEGVQWTDKLLRERYQVAQTRTYAQIGTQRVGTIFADQLNNDYGTGSNFFGSV